MFKIKIFSIGKTKEAWLESAISEYLKRLQPIASIECLWCKSDAQLIEMAKKENCYICLDPKGPAMTSEAFSTLLTSTLEKGGSRLTFVIGGAEGLPKELKEHASLLSLSSMTFTHQLTRLVLIEQIYRAFEIAKGSNYHK